MQRPPLTRDYSFDDVYISRGRRQAETERKAAAATAATAVTSTPVTPTTAPTTGKSHTSQNTSVGTIGTFGSSTGRSGRGSSFLVGSDPISNPSGSDSGIDSRYGSMAEQGGSGSAPPTGLSLSTNDLDGYDFHAATTGYGGGYHHRERERDSYGFGNGNGYGTNYGSGYYGSPSSPSAMGISPMNMGGMGQGGYLSRQRQFQDEMDGGYGMRRRASFQNQEGRKDSHASRLQAQQNEREGQVTSEPRMENETQIEGEEPDHHPGTRLNSMESEHIRQSQVQLQAQGRNQDRNTDAQSDHRQGSRDYTGDAHRTPSQQHQHDEDEAKHYSLTGWRRALRNFTLLWFQIPMGTGLISILLYRIPPPYDSHWCRVLGIIVFIFNAVLFVSFSILMGLRFILFPGVIRKVIRSEKESLYAGAWPIGLATLVDMWMFVAVQRANWGGENGVGGWAAALGWAGFWVDAVVSIVVVIGVSFLVITMHQHPLEDVSGAQLMCILPPIVCSALGAIVASSLANPQHAVWTMIVSYILWGLGVPLALVVITLIYSRLALKKELPKAEVVSMLVPVGPLGTGGFAVMVLGQVARKRFPVTENLGMGSGEVLYTLGFITALIFWGYAVLWLCLSIGVMLKYRHFPFNMSWWSFIFPIGVYTLSTYTLGVELPSRFFKILGIVQMVLLVVLWMIVGAFTVLGVVKGSVFEAPWLGDPDDGNVEVGMRRKRRGKTEKEEV